jgi:hypothetical protein
MIVCVNRGMIWFSLSSAPRCSLPHWNKYQYVLDVSTALAKYLQVDISLFSMHLMNEMPKWNSFFRCGSVIKRIVGSIN